jgi:ATP synthase mitochondrial F1 complex assembly factor 1
MLSVASKYPCFVLPVPKEGAQVAEEKAAADQKAYEFHFMEWGFHGAPPEPQPADLFAKPQPSGNPQTSTILFTPLQEYKQRTSFATPYLVLTNYTELARSHGIVLLRGEITPSTSGSIEAGGDGRYMLSQQDAQLLALGIQKFYLWDESKGEREALLKTFHEDPSSFKWEDLLKHTDFSA